MQTKPTGRPGEQRRGERLAMDARLLSFRSEAAVAVRSAMVSAEHLQLSLKSELSQEERTLTLSANKSLRDGYDGMDEI